MIVTLKDIAEKVGVHPSTVSRVLRDIDGDIQTSNKKREEIIKLARELNYQPNQMARSFRLRKSQTLAYIMPDISDRSFARFAKILEQEAVKYDLSLLICNTGGDINKEKYYINKLYAMGIDGIFIIPADKASENFKSLEKLNIPYVVINLPEEKGRFQNSENYSRHSVHKETEDQYIKRLFVKLNDKMRSHNKRQLSAAKTISSIAV